MERGKNQVVFRYLPDMLIDYQQGKSIARICKWLSKPAEFVAEKRVIHEVANRVNRFDIHPGYPPRQNADEYIVLEPISIQVELYPRTFVCQKCRKVYSFRDYSTALQSTNGKFRCTKGTGSGQCGGNLRQEHFVFSHHCGYLGQLEPPQCPDHGSKHIKLDKRGSFIARNFRWVCGICNRELKSVNTYCQRCNKMINAPNVFRKGSVYYPHYVSMVNVHDHNIYADEDYCKLVVASYLGMCSLEQLKRDFTEDETGISTSQIHKLFQNLRDEGLPEEFIKKQMAELNISEDSLPLDTESVLGEINHLIPEIAFPFQRTALNLHDYSTLLSKDRSKSLDAYVTQAEEGNHPSILRIKLFSKQLEKFGVSNAFIIDGLPLAIASYGYTRGSYSDRTFRNEPVTLNRFPSDGNYPDRVPIYVHRTDTEAISLELDRGQIIKWLEMNDVIPKTNLKDSSEAKLWFLRNIRLDEIPLFGSIVDNTSATWYVYNLMHTMSHLLIRNASVIAGFDTNSLGELMFPSIPAIVIYANNQSSFQIGGLFTLFESGIYSWIDNSIRNGKTCIYDPICLNTEGACHACLHLSEITCEHFNRDLNRKTLLGGNIGENQEISGFWDH